ncbi:MAG TPA: glycosyltransferase family 2 protein [Myxococcales bacterium]|nr:glycosyltransferase family 2 protein [Myxococcales bacterium]
MAEAGVMPLRTVRRLGRALSRILARDTRPRPLTYAAWSAQRAPSRRDLEEQRRRAESLGWRPAFDVVVVRRPGDSEAALRTTASLAAQTYRRMAVHECADPSADALNRAAAAGRGELLVLLDAGDRLVPQALFSLAATGARDAGLLYSDEDLLGQQPLLKPAWSPEALLSHDSVGGVAAVRRELFEAAGGFREMGGAERHDLLLRLLPRLGRVKHVPQVLLHRTADRPQPEEDRRRAISDHVLRAYGPHYRVAPDGAILYEPPTPARVSIVVPTRDRADLLRACIESLDRHRFAARAELVVVDNGSVEPATHEYLATLARREATKVLPYPAAFNWSAVNNFAARHATGDYLLFLNNDVEALAPGWLDALLAFASRPEIGMAGGLLLYPDGTVQHAGVVVGLTGYAGHVFAGRRPDEITPFGRADRIRDCTAVTGACMMMRREVFDQLGGFDESFILCGSDVEICLRARARGLRVVMTPHARLLHHEAKTRGTEIPRSDFQRSFAAYEPYLRGGDPYFNPNLSLKDPAVMLRDGPEDMLEFARSFL